jgi:hypothetical protein
MAVFGDKSAAKYYSMQNAMVSIGGITGVALNVNIQYARPVSMIPTLTTDKHFSIGKASGSFTGTFVFEQSVVGKLSEKCKVGSCYFYIGGDCNNAQGSVSCNGCVIQSVQIQADGQNGYATLNITAAFSTLNVLTVLA